MTWTPMMDAAPSSVLWRGTVFRCKGKWPYESMVDFMLIDSYEARSGFILMVATGRKSGITLQALPEACRATGNRRAVLMGWLQQEWTTWIYPDCAPLDVYFAESYPAPGAIP